jgi:hypothetical protein
MKIDQTRIWLNNQRAERAGLKKLQAMPSGSCWFRRCCETIVEKHVAAAAVAAAASADKLPRGCGHFKRLKDNPFNDPGVTCYFLLSSLQRLLPPLRIVVLICSFSIGGKGSVY